MLSILLLFESAKILWLDSPGPVALSHTLYESVPSPLSIQSPPSGWCPSLCHPLAHPSRSQRAGGTLDAVQISLPEAEPGGIMGRPDGEGQMEAIHRSTILMATF